jgi:Protein of unknown function (DUF3313)
MNMRTAVIVLSVLALIGCVTRQARHVGESGFLGDYSLLKPGPEGGAKLVYKNPNADMKSYKKIVLDPVAIWTANDSQMNDLSKQDRQMVADRLFSLLYARLSKDYTMVTSPEPGTMRIAAALTSAEASSPVLDTISTIVPIGLGLSTIKAIATGKPAFVGEATAELKVTDATTNEILFEAVDSRVGTKNPSGVWDKWEDVDSALAYWTERIGYRLCVERGAAGCVEP